MTLLLMYWEEDGTKKKRLEERLRAKKLEREGKSVTSLETLESSADLNRAIQALNEQRNVSQTQSQQIAALTEALRQQSALMETLLEKQQNPQQYEVVYRPPDKVERLQDLHMPVLDESNIPIIDKSHIDSIEGKAGSTAEVKGDVADKAAKLKAIMKKKKEKKDE